MLSVMLKVERLSCEKSWFLRSLPAVGGGCLSLSRWLSSAGRADSRHRPLLCSWVNSTIVSNCLKDHLSPAGAPPPESAWFGTAGIVCERCHRAQRKHGSLQQNDVAVWKPDGAEASDAFHRCSLRKARLLEPLHHEPRSSIHR